MAAPAFRRVEAAGGFEPSAFRPTPSPVPLAITAIGRFAGQGCLGSNAFCADETTGAWSGISDGLEVAGCFDTVIGEVFDAYPVLRR
jgi:hypothetical protein